MRDLIFYKYRFIFWALKILFDSKFNNNWKINLQNKIDQDRSVAVTSNKQHKIFKWVKNKGLIYNEKKDGTNIMWHLQKIFIMNPRFNESFYIYLRVKKLIIYDFFSFSKSVDLIILSLALFFSKSSFNIPY